MKDILIIIVVLGVIYLILANNIKIIKKQKLKIKSI